MLIETNINEKLFNYARELRFGDLHFKLDQETGLFAIVAIHNTKLGPALGGSRCREYSTITDAIRDALRLAQGMSYKAAVVGLPLGGGKSVLLKPKHIPNRQAYFEKFGEFIDELGGRYITAVDSGTSTQDMDWVANKTRYVTSTSAGMGDPSPFTADGIFLSIKAGVKQKLKRDSLEGLTVAIQGVGHVGMHLAEHLHKAGAKLIITDTIQGAVDDCVKNFSAKVVGLEEIYSVECDIFAPCALGAVINDITIPQLQAGMVIGAANNQLLDPRHGDELHKRGILYGPDYVVNAGGLICACAQFYTTPVEMVKKQVESIYDTISEIFARSARENIPTHTIADRIAEEKIYGKALNGSSMAHMA